MEIVSVGWATELALLAARGSEVEQHRTHVVVRTPERPDSRQENFVLLPRAPLDRDAGIAVGRYVDAFGSDATASLAFDDATVERRDLRAFQARGFQVTTDVVLVATDVAAPAIADVEVHVAGSVTTEITFEAWTHGRLAGSAGIATAGPDWVRLHPPRTSGVDRLAGVAQLLVHAAWEYAVAREERRGLVLVADHDHPEVPDYLAFGFDVREHQVRAFR